jgi:hypothetical protein
METRDAYASKKIDWLNLGFDNKQGHRVPKYQFVCVGGFEQSNFGTKF